MDKSTENSHFSQGKPLPDIVRHQVVRLHLQGRSQRSIATVLDISKSTVGNIVSNYSETGEENTLRNVGVENARNWMLKQ